MLPYFTLVRFGRWDEILRATPPPDGAAPYPLAIWRYARGTALARSGQAGAAQQELARLEALAADPALMAMKIKNINPAAQMVRIAVLTLGADIALSRGETQRAVAFLQEATRVEDALAYDEPHLWLAPTRQALGAALLAAGRAADAERVYREDLAHYPDNGWSLGGLALALARQGKTALAQEAGASARAAFGTAERVPAGSRF